MFILFFYLYDLVDDGPDVSFRPSSSICNNDVENVMEIDDVTLVTTQVDENIEQTSDNQ